MRWKPRATGFSYQNEIFKLSLFIYFNYKNRKGGKFKGWNATFGKNRLTGVAIVTFFPRISGICRSQLLHHGIVQNFIYKILTVRNNIYSICVNLDRKRCFVVIHWLFFFYNFCDRFRLLLHWIKQKLMYKILIKEHCIHFVFLHIAH